MAADMIVNGNGNGDQRVTNALLKRELECQNKKLDEILSKVDQLAEHQHMMNTNQATLALQVETNCNEIEKLRASTSLKDIVVAIGAFIGIVLGANK